MPTFDFQCQKCGTVFEESIPFGSKTYPPCAACAYKKVEKLISPPSIQFKGDGFYKTDSRPAPKTSTSTSLSATEGTPSSSDVKPDTGGSESIKSTSEANEAKSPKKSDG